LAILLAILRASSLLSSLAAEHRRHNVQSASARLGGNMYTTILAYVIAFLGLIMIGSGIFFILFTEEHRVTQRYYAMAIGMISGGFAMGGIAQALRLLLVLVERP
jgi:hypothetical protein